MSEPPISQAQARALRAFARRGAAMDDPVGPGLQARRTVTLTQIIDWAKDALGDDG